MPHIEFRRRLNRRRRRFKPKPKSIVTSIIKAMVWLWVASIVVGLLIAALIGAAL